MKTAIDQLLELLQKEIKFINDDDAQEDKYFRAGLKHAYTLAKEKLKQERKQITEAYSSGCSAEYGREDCVEYYNETFTTNPNI